MRRLSIRVDRTARVCTIGGGAATPPREVWIACHGYRQLAHRFGRRFGPIASDTRLVIVPEALSRFYLESDGGRHGPASKVGATWMTREDRANEISDYIRYLDAVLEQFGPPRQGPRDTRVGFGFSQGAHTAARWAMLGGAPVDRLILWGAYLPQDLDLEACAPRWRSTEVIQVFGEVDPTRSDRLADEQAQRLERAGLEIVELKYAGGHEIDTALLLEIADASNPEYP